MKELLEIQQRLQVGKDRNNEFAGFKYRSCEDIYARVKPILKELNCTLTLNDDLVFVGDRHYVKSVAVLKNSTGSVESATAFAREVLEKKKSDGSQLTGSASSYARKYAMEGLFLLDNNDDPDSLKPEAEKNTWENELKVRIQETNDLNSLRSSMQEVKKSGKLTADLEEAFIKRAKELE